MDECFFVLNQVIQIGELKYTAGDSELEIVIPPYTTVEQIDLYDCKFTTEVITYSDFETFEADWFTNDGNILRFETPDSAKPA